MYLARLMGYNYSIQYRTGKSNVVVDALSRIADPAVSSLLFLSMPSLTFLETLKQQLGQDKAFVQLQQAILVDLMTHPDHFVVQDLILKNDRIWLPSGSSFIPTLLLEYHSSPTGGHVGVTKTLARLTENFTWTRIIKDVEQFVVACLDC